jgi:putative membrane protein insertion efficiency factor
MNAAQDSKTGLHAGHEASECLTNGLHENDAAVLTKTETSTASRKLWRSLLHVPALLAIGAVKLYQYLISPWLGRRCRFYPSCSQYFILSVQKFGLIRGFCKGTARICRCHPWNPGGYDPP